MITYNSKSPYFKTLQTSWYLDFWIPRNFKKHSSDYEYQIPNGHNNRPDLSAKSLYGNERYWWVFAAINPDLIKDPIFDHTGNKFIYVPTIERLTGVIN